MAERLIQYPLGVAGVTTRVLEAGRGDRVMLFVHGLSTRADRWRGNVQALAGPDLRCLAFDLPGHGLADKPAGFDYGVPGLARYLGGVLDALGIERCMIVSTSLGSHVAGWFAVHAPQRVSGHLIVAGLGLVPIAEETGQAIRRSVRDTSREGIRAKLGNVFADPVTHATEALVEEEWRCNNSPGALQALSALGDYVATGLNADVVGERVAALLPQTPVQLLWGEHDRIVPAAVADAARRVLPTVPLHRIAGAGHAPYIENPDAFHAQVRAFAAQLGVPASAQSAV
jgi:2-hydroxy-6-oxonona-2,4-dienedioate hydrolase